MGYFGVPKSSLKSKYQRNYRQKKKIRKLHVMSCQKTLSKHMAMPWKIPARGSN
jgi:hypothetical protein